MGGARIGAVKSGRAMNRVKQKDIEALRAAGPPREQDAIAEIPAPPAWLEGMALAMYERLARDLIRPHILVATDATALSLFAEALAFYVECKIQLQTRTPGQPMAITDIGATGAVVKSPLFSATMMAWDRVLKCCVEFGLTPSSRTRAIMRDMANDVLNVPEEDEAQKEAKFFRKPRAVK